MPRNGRFRARGGIQPDIMFSAVVMEEAAVIAKMKFEKSAIHDCLLTLLFANRSEQEP